MLDTDHAIALADRMPGEFLADLAVELGPDLHRPLAPLAAALPPRQRGEAPTRARDLGLLGDLGVLGEALEQGTPGVEPPRA